MATSYGCDSNHLHGHRLDAMECNARRLLSIKNDLLAALMDCRKHMGVQLQESDDARARVRAALILDTTEALVAKATGKA